MLLDKTEKTCTLCKRTLPFSFFTSSKYSKDGFRYQCRDCNQSYQQDKGKRRKWHTTWYQELKTNKPELFLWKQAKHRARENHLEFTIEIEDVVIPQVCPYFNIPLKTNDKKWAPSLDRIDNTKGYIKGNIQVISLLANRMKFSATREELISFAKGVLDMTSKEEQCLCS